MEAESLPNYGYSDVSAHTDLCVCDTRSFGARGTLVHTTSGIDSLKWLQGASCVAGTPAGADYLIERDGHTYRITAPGYYAYHAGVSLVQLDRTYTGDGVSEALVGVELECLDTEVPTYQQIDSLAALVVRLAGELGWRWPFIIYGHYAVARPLGRRSDPVNMDWGGLMGRLYVRAQQANIPGL